MFENIKSLTMRYYNESMGKLSWEQCVQKALTNISLDICSKLCRQMDCSIKELSQMILERIQADVQNMN